MSHRMTIAARSAPGYEHPDACDLHEVSVRCGPRGLDARRHQRSGLVFERYEPSLSGDAVEFLVDLRHVHVGRFD